MRQMAIVKARPSHRAHDDRTVIACVDVHYMETGGARAAVVAFADWDSAVPTEQHLVTVDQVAPYESGAFYKRELPCLRAALGALGTMPEIVIVDGHTWLDAGRPGLGARLLEADPRIRTVVGVAKTRFAGTAAKAVLRGTSATPLWVDEAGAPVDAAVRVAAMHGAHRVPTMLRLVDQLCRGHATTS
ncbi:MAG: Endonuclease [Labilithrix sp.]|nr:Endonuclease [Labilithrix sp.]